MKVYVLVECDFATGESVVRNVFKSFDTAMEDAKFLADERVKGYSQTRVVEKLDDRYIVRYKEEEDEEKELYDRDTVAVYYVKTKLLIEND